MDIYGQYVQLYNYGHASDFLLKMRSTSVKSGLIREQ